VLASSVGKLIDEWALSRRKLSYGPAHNIITTAWSETIGKSGKSQEVRGMAGSS
jgi:hypothetical protein